MKNIVVLDGYILNPGDLSWQGLRDLGNCTFYDRTPADLVVSRGNKANIVIINKVQFTKEVIAQLPELNYIGVTATGYNNVDVDAADARGIVVTNVPGYSTNSVAQMTLALLLELTNHTAFHADLTRTGEWSASSDFSYLKKPLTELHGLTMGIVGYGHIAQAVANLAQAFGMKILVHTRTPLQDQPNLHFVRLEELLTQSDVVSLHCPLTPETQHLINAKTLALMKPSALLINTSRGQLIHEESLAAALNAGKIAGAGLDVLSNEPPPLDNPLLKAKNCIITPHIGWASKAARQRLLDIVASNVVGFLSGTLQNSVNRSY